MDPTADQPKKTGNAEKVSIVLAEPNLLLREKIAGVLARNDRVWCVVQVSRRDDLARVTAQLHPDFVLVDVVMLRDADSAEVSQWLSHASQVYALVDSRSAPYERLCSRLKIDGLLEKSSVAESIAREIARPVRAKEPSGAEAD